MNIIFYPDSDPSSGLGHISRCAALYQQLLAELPSSEYWVVGEKEKLEVKFHDTNFLRDISHFTGSPKSTIVIIDHYNFESSNGATLKKLGFKIVVIDDFLKKYSYSDLIINHGKQREPSSTLQPNYLLGFTYLISSLSFQPYRAVKKNIEIKKIVLSFGGSAPKELTIEWLQIIHKVFPTAKITLLSPLTKQDITLKDKVEIEFLWGLTEEELSSVFRSVDLAIVPSSNLSLEIACTNTPLAVGTFVENQKFIYDSLVSNCMAFGLGDYNEEKSTCEERLTNVKSRFNGSVQDQLKAQLKLDAQKSGKAIGNQMRLLAKNVSIRNATADDCKFIYELANDQAVRENSINSEKIEWENHIKWYQSKLNSDDLFHVYCVKNEPIGYVRIEKKGEETIISIALSAEMRGQKLAPLMIACSSDLYLSILGNDEPILAYIWENNPASGVSFERAGYQVLKHKILDNRNFSILYYGH